MGAGVAAEEGSTLDGGGENIHKEMEEIEKGERFHWLLLPRVSEICFKWQICDFKPSDSEVF